MPVFLLRDNHTTVVSTRTHFLESKQVRFDRHVKGDLYRDMTAESRNNLTRIDSIAGQRLANTRFARRVSNKRIHEQH
jgi:hypothetical protein